MAFNISVHEVKLKFPLRQYLMHIKLVSCLHSITTYVVYRPSSWHSINWFFLKNWPTSFTAGIDSPVYVGIDIFSQHFVRKYLRYITYFTWLLPDHTIPEYLPLRVPKASGDITRHTFLVRSWKIFWYINI